MDFQGAMTPAAETTIEISAPPVEAEKPLTEDKVQSLKVVELKVELQHPALEKNGNKYVL